LQDQLLAMLRDQLVAIACGAVFLFIGCLPVALPRFAIAGKRGSLFGWEYGAHYGEPGSWLNRRRWWLQQSVAPTFRVAGSSFPGDSFHWQPSSMAQRDDITLMRDEYVVVTTTAYCVLQEPNWSAPPFWPEQRQQDTRISKKYEFNWPRSSPHFRLGRVPFKGSTIFTPAPGAQ